MKFSPMALLEQHRGVREAQGTVDRLDVVVLSLERWDDVWRRNQFLVRELLRLRPRARVLFVEPPIDVPYELRNGRVPERGGLRAVEGWRRLFLLRPLKYLPRRLGPGADWLLGRSVYKAMRRLGFDQAVLWVNDDSYAKFAVGSKRPFLYDVTDDWTLSNQDETTRARRSTADELLVKSANEVVVCSPSLVQSRGRHRKVVHLPNAVDVDHFRRPQERPADLPPGPILVYAGTLHENRLDVQLCVALAEALSRATLVLVGPDALAESSRERLCRHDNVMLLGPRPYEAVPGYLQHADVVVVPHAVTPFTESLDPIKAYECLAIGRPTVATPVAGFRGLGPPIWVASPENFIRAVQEALHSPPATEFLEVPTWQERGRSFVETLEKVAGCRGHRTGGSTNVER